MLRRGLTRHAGTKIKIYNHILYKNAIKGFFNYSKTAYIQKNVLLLVCLNMNNANFLLWSMVFFFSTLLKEMRSFMFFLYFNGILCSFFLKQIFMLHKLRLSFNFCSIITTITQSIRWLKYEKLIKKFAFITTFGDDIPHGLSWVNKPWGFFSQICLQKKSMEKRIHYPLICIYTLLFAFPFVL